MPLPFFREAACFVFVVFFQGCKELFLLIAAFVAIGVECGVVCVEVFAVQVILNYTKSVTEMTNSNGRGKWL